MLLVYIKDALLCCKRGPFGIQKSIFDNAINGILENGMTINIIN